MRKTILSVIVIFILIYVAVYMMFCRKDISRIFLTECKNEIFVSDTGIDISKKWLKSNLMPLINIGETLNNINDGKFNDLACEDSVYKENTLSVNKVEDTAINEETTAEALEDLKEDDDRKTRDAIAISNIPGIEYSMEQLCDFEFLVSNCYTVDKSTSVNQDELDAKNLLSMNMVIDTEDSGYKVLIYHSHGSEGFCDSREGVMEDTVIGVGDELTRLLNDQYGIKTYHDRNVYDMVDGVLDRSYAYDLSREAVNHILEENPSIEVAIDLHRDGVREDLHLVRVLNGRPTAQIMFLNGVSRLNVNGDVESMYNPNKITNLAFSLQMHLAGKQMYGDLIRRIYISGYRFNLDILGRSTLIEVGAQTNTVEEAKNAMIPLAAILNSVLTDDKNIVSN